MAWRKFGGIVALGAASASVFSGASIYYEKEKFYDKFLIPAMQKLDPELAHSLAILSLRWGLIPTSRYVDTPLLAQNIKHLTFRNPIGMAAGFDKEAEAVKSLERIGFGFVEIGSVTPEPQEGNERPRLFRYGFNSEGHEAVVAKLKEMKKKHPVHCVLGVNLGKNKTSEDAVSDYLKGIQVFSEVADYFVINVSSPNTPGLRELQEKENLKTLLMPIIDCRNNLNVAPKPLLFLKLSPDLTDQQKRDIVNLMRDSKCRVDGLIVSNTTIDRDPSLRSAESREAGGLSGQPIKQKSTNLIKEMYKLTKGSLPIIGCGGVFNGEDAYEKIRAGASLVQIYTSFIYKGPPVVTKIKKELESLVKNDNCGNITDIIGKGNKK